MVTGMLMATTMVEQFPLQSGHGIPHQVHHPHGIGIRLIDHLDGDTGTAVDRAFCLSLF
jgi:hypothetical protein